VDGIKVDLMKYPYPPVYPIVVEDGIRMLSIRDIIPMKLSAISNRGAKKDFFDIHFLLREFRFDEMLMLYSERFNMPEVISVLRSIQYFDDAELENDPLCFEQITWAEVKNTIRHQVKAYLR
jgi:predicted nucleotidyltransferase component of viral defense system